MKKRIKIWFHSGSTSDIKEVTLQKSVLGFASLIIIFAVIGASFVGYDYYCLKMESFNNVILNQTISKQTSEIKNQRSQIQSFADKIEILKNRIGDLSKFEKKVGLIVGLST